MRETKRLSGEVWDWLVGDLPAILLREIGRPDLWITAALWLFGVVCLLAAYQLGGLAWRGWKPHRQGGPVPTKWGQSWLRSGAWMELYVMSYSAVLLYIVTRILGDGGEALVLSPSAPLAGPSIYGLLHHQRETVAVTAICLVGYVLWFCFSQARKAYASVPYPEGSRDWSRGYIPYFPANTVQFGFYALAGLVVLWQLEFDYGRFRAAETDLVRAQLQVASFKAGSAPLLLVEIENLNALHWATVKGITEQINTIFLLFFFVLVLALLAEYSPLSSAYTDRGGNRTKWVLLLILAIVLGAGWIMFNSLYLGITNSTLAAMEPRYPALLEGSRSSAEGWRLLQRYTEIATTLRDSKGITGFILTVMKDRGGVLLFLFFLQLVFGPRLKRMAGLEAAGEVEPRTGKGKAVPV